MYSMTIFAAAVKASSEEINTTTNTNLRKNIYNIIFSSASEELNCSIKKQFRTVTDSDQK